MEFSSKYFELESKYHKLLANVRPITNSNTNNTFATGKETLHANNFKEIYGHTHADQVFKSIKKYLNSKFDESLSCDEQTDQVHSPTKQYYEMLTKSKTEQMDSKTAKWVQTTLAHSKKSANPYKMLELKKLQDEMGRHLSYATDFFVKIVNL